MGYDKLSKEELIIILNEKDKLLAHKDRVSLLGESIEEITEKWRSPLISIFNSSNNVQIKKILGLLDDDLCEKELDNIIKNTDYLLQTIEDFSDFCKDTKYYNVINVQSLIHKVLSIASSRIEAKNIDIQTQFDEECFIKANENELMQVILNIIYNAIDALIHKAKNERKIILKSIRKDNKVSLLIEDNAGGIEEKNLEKIFDKYFTTKGSHGSGIGLYHSKQIIENNLNGSLSVHNSGFGACFVIDIPAYQFINEKKLGE